MKRSRSLPMVLRRILVLPAAWLLLGCGDAPQQTRVAPFTGEQIDRLDAGVRSGGAAAEPDLTEEDRPVWVSTGLRDHRTRMVVHVRLGVSGDLENVARHEARCAHVLDRMQEYLLPGQRVELYLVFDDSIHACVGEQASSAD